MREALADPAVQSSWQVIDNALRRMVAHLTPREVEAWSLLRHFHERALPELAKDEDVDQSEDYEWPDEG